MLVKNVFKLPPQKLTEGEVGIEVEVEGRQLPKTDKRYWLMTQDGSLKAEEAVEYVLARPMSVEDASAALQYLDESYSKSGSTVDDSVRAGVHVHVNVQNMNIPQLYSFITLYLILEGLLVRWCGESREGNLFCLRSYDAEWLPKVLTKAIRTLDFQRLFTNDDIRYASVNVKALAEHGSLEFRSMRGTRDLSLVDVWMRMLHRIKTKSLEFEDPIDVITGFSGADKRDFVTNVMGSVYGKLLLSVDNSDELLFEGMRSAQDIAYATKNWGSLRTLGSSNPFKQGEISVRPDPFDVNNAVRPRAGGPRPTAVRPDFVEVDRAEAAPMFHMDPRVNAALERIQRNGRGEAGVTRQVNWDTVIGQQADMHIVAGGNNWVNGPAPRPAAVPPQRGR